MIQIKKNICQKIYEELLLINFETDRMNYEPNIPWLTIDEREHIYKKSGIFQKKETRTIDQTLRILVTRVLE